MVVAEEWLQDKEITPSGTNWDDLYSHLIVNHDKINPKEKVFVGFRNFVCHTKYNDRGENLLNCLCVKEQDSVATTSKSRKDAQKAAATEKNSFCSIEVGNPGMFGKRGLHIDSRLQIIEIAQFEEAKDR